VSWVRDLREWAISLGLLLGVLAASVVLLGPVIWWLTPAEATPQDQLLADAGTRTTLVWIMVVAGLPAAVLLGRASARRTLRRRHR
jgi:hypothetical protein